MNEEILNLYIRIKILYVSNTYTEQMINENITYKN